MKYAEIAVEPPFDRMIHCVWFLTGRLNEYRPQRVVPDGRLELLVHRADPFSRILRNGSARVQETVLVAGQLTGPIDLQPGSMIDVVGIRLTPLGAHAILDLPLKELTNLVLPLREVCPRLASLLMTESHRRGSHEDAARSITRLLGRRRTTEIDPFMEHAARSLSWGTAVEVLARRSGTTMRTLQRRFLHEMGLSPKVYQRVVRFRRAFSLLQADRNGARAAAVSGYYDQAHMIRDFVRFAGSSPRSFFGSSPALAQAFSKANHGETESAEKNH